MPSKYLGSHIPTLRSMGSLPLLSELYSLSQPENEDWYLHLTLLLGGAKLLVCVCQEGEP